jgi:hypothetical protein
MILQLSPSIPVLVTPNSSGIPEGKGLAIAWLDYGEDHHMLWGVAYDATGQVWWVPNPLIRLQENRSLGRDHADILHS